MAAKHRAFAKVSQFMRRSFDANGERQVSAPEIYGFEMVDAHRVAMVPHVRRYQSKIYVESNQSNFQRIFAEFTSMQILPLYRRLLVRSGMRSQPQMNQNGRPGSRDVFPASYGILAWAGARAAAESNNA